MKVILDRETIGRILCDHVAKHSDAQNLFSAGKTGQWQLETLSKEQATIAFSPTSKPKPSGVQSPKASTPKEVAGSGGTTTTRAAEPVSDDSDEEVEVAEDPEDESNIPDAQPYTPSQIHN